MARRVIDLSQPLSKDSQLHPFFPTVQVLRHLQHGDATGDEKSFDAQIIITSNHAATHVDALGHFDPDPKAAKIDEMPLDTFCGDAVCIDVREYPAGHEVCAGCDYLRCNDARYGWCGMLPPLEGGVTDMPYPGDSADGLLAGRTAYPGL